MRHFWRRGVPILACALVLGAPAPALAQDHGGGEVVVSQNGDEVSIGNDYLTRTFSSKGGTWKTTSIVNKRLDNDLVLVPQAGSEDFVINLVRERGTLTAPTQELAGKETWKPQLTNNKGQSLNQVTTLFDGKNDTYVDQWDLPGYPISLVIDLGSKQNVGSFSLQKRPGAKLPVDGRNGTMGTYELYVSDDGTNWTPAGTGEFTEEDYGLHTENGLYNVGNVVYGNFDKVHNTRFVKIVQTSDALGNTEEFTAAEIGLFSDQAVVVGGTGSDTTIETSELKVASISADDEADVLRVEFEPVQFAGNTWQVAEVVSMEDGAHYMNSHLEIKAAHADASAIDYIDLDSFVLPKDAKDVWSIPDESKVSSMFLGRHELMLGQPIYVNGMFLGSEFPAEETDVVDKTNTTKIRYYSGKTIAKMAEDGQEAKLAEDGSGVFRTWENVVGAAQGTPEDVVKTDFFAYIEDLATPSEFRKQYNSWFDNMLNITPASVERSFLGADKGLASNGVEPIDSYVVDDGWNNYNSDKFGMAAPGMAGTTPNRTGFWEFNSKWPNELYDSTSLAHNLQSSFGIWVGPRGGYNYPDKLGRIVEDAGTGFYCPNSHDICTGSRVYLKNYTERFLDYQKRFDIDYWKWDGFAVTPCRSEGHGHMVGGAHNMYFTSDMWEAWTDLFETFREARAEEGKGLWINATCYVNPSPWLLRWVNTVWLQDCADTAQSGNKDASRHQQKIYYRDHVYSNIYRNNDLQFPLKNVYNHDPIYGVSDGSNATTEDFREFLFDNAMRGTAFWELYYSPSIMDEAKWQVNADALDFAERNHEVLKNAKLFCTDEAFPTTNLGASVDGVYGYSAWSGNEGIVSFVNPTGSEQTYSLELTDLVGVPKGMKNLTETQVYPYAAAPSGKTVSYGDTLTVTLEPHSSLIYQYGAGDTRAPQVVSAKITGDDTVRVVFNTRMSDATSFKLDGKAVEATLMDDYRTFELKAEGLGKTAELTVEGATSVFGVEAVEGVNGTREIEAAGDLAVLKRASDAKGIKEFETDFSQNPMLDLRGKAVTAAGKGVSGTSDFAVELAVKTGQAGTTLVQQGSDWSLSIDADGYVVFTVGELSVTSKHEVTTVTELDHGTLGTDEYVPTQTKTETAGAVNDNQVHTIVASREPNGVLKLYVDGALVNSAYAEGVTTDLSGAPVTVGSEGMSGYVSGVAVRNSARYYDEAADFAKAYPAGQDMAEVPQTGWSIKACSDANNGSDGPATHAIDGNPATYWHSNYSGTDTCKGTHELAIKFGKDVTFDNLVYVGRPGGGNGDWTAVKVYGVAKDGTETKIADLSTVEFDEDRKVVIAFDEAQTFSGVRFEIKGVGGYASAAEILATTNIEQADMTPVEELRAHAAELDAKTNKDDYTAESYRVFADALEKVWDLNPFAASSLDKVDALRAELDEAHAGLKEVEVPPVVNPDREKLEDLLADAKAIDTTGKTDESAQALADAIAQAERVLADPDATADELKSACGDLQAAIDGLADKEPGGGDPGTDEPSDKPKPDDGDNPDGKPDHKPGDGNTPDGNGDGSDLPLTGDPVAAQAAVAGAGGFFAMLAGAFAARKRRK
ncbi:MAG: discoidin domain-containing protein [Coriobacteriaceae bacterium]|nr:discoidin domain-containing protein [Coriobacteriaceae bacterium]